MIPNMLCPRNALSPKLLKVSTAKIGVALSTVRYVKKVPSSNNNYANIVLLGLRFCEHEKSLSIKSNALEKMHFQSAVQTVKTFLGRASLC